MDVGDVVVAGKYTRSLAGEAQLSLLARACNNLPQTPPRNLQLLSPTPSTLHLFSFPFSLLLSSLLPYFITSLPFHHVRIYWVSRHKVSPYCKGASANGNELQITNISHLEE